MENLKTNQEKIRTKLEQYTLIIMKILRTANKLPILLVLIKKECTSFVSFSEAI